ncbi:MAG: hypothetical protein MJ052_02155 [Sphaerochaetaceae bacterium]|nr:hypothetical protein [Sphaerochaetaceae bacterium]
MNTVRLREILRQTDMATHRDSQQSPLKVLVADLTSETFSVIDSCGDWFGRYGAVLGYAIRLWGEFCTGDENPVVIAAGKKRTAIVFRNPVTELVTFNTVSSSFGAELNGCGYCALVITGHLKRSGAVVVDGVEKHCVLSEKLRNARVSQVNLFFRNCGECLATGPSADNGIHFAAACLSGKITGRGGLGFRLGEKNLKAVVIHAASINDVRESIEQRGSANLSLLTEQAYRNGWAAVSNFRRRTDPRMFHLTEREANRRLAEYQGLFPDTASVIMLGSNCDCYDIVSVADRFNLCFDLGLDPVSTGNVIGWLLDASRRNVINITGFTGEDSEAVMQLIEDMAMRSGIGGILGSGTGFLASSCSDTASSFCIHGVECGPVDFRGSFASALNSAAENYFPVFFEMASGLCSKHPVFWTVLNEDLVLGYESLGLDPETEIRTLTTVSALKLKHAGSSEKYAKKIFGWNSDAAETGRNVWQLLNGINGVAGKIEYKIPDYFITDSDSDFPEPAVVPFSRLFDEYMTMRGYLYKGVTVNEK